ncbi:MAG: RNA pyrophosphohydrolase, partial [Candidatus Fonsibacter sp.]
MKGLEDLPYRKGVGIMLLNQEAKVFIGKRIDNTKAWQMPQGGVDDKEDIESAAKRELKEETGITSIEIIKKSEKEFIYDLPNELLGKIWDGKYKGQKQTWFLIKFTGDQSEINIKQKK